MRIESMAVYTANLEYTGKAYAFAGGRSHQAFETKVVVLVTDTGLEGYGEVCPCGPNYMAAFAEGFRHIQIKLGHEVEADIDLVRTLGRLKQPDELWIGDINGAWRRDHALRFSEAIALKVSNFGGLTPSRVIRDVCADAGIAMTIEDA